MRGLIEALGITALIAPLTLEDVIAARITFITAIVGITPTRAITTDAAWVSLYTAPDYESSERIYFKAATNDRMAQELRSLINIGSAVMVTGVMHKHDN